ncbi:hypothetical protein ES703_66463 [subsurface metagenome]
MPDLEVLEIVALLVLLIPFSFEYYIIKRRRDMLPLLPGATFLVLSYLCTNLEAVFAPEIFDFMEHFFIMLAGISFFIGMVYRYFYKTSNKQQLFSKEKRN